MRSYCSSGKRYRTKHPVQITLLQTIRCPDVTENQGNASFSLPGNACIRKIRTVHHQVMPTRKQKKRTSISTHSRTRQKRLGDAEPSSWHDWGAAASKHVVKFRRGEKTSRGHQFGFMIPAVAPTGRRYPAGDEATITPYAPIIISAARTAREATSTAPTANSYNPAWRLTRRRST